MRAHTPGPIQPFTDKCGCTNTPAFRRCPTHAAAPRMLDVLRACLRRFESEPVGVATHIHAIRAILKDIEG